MRNAFRVLLVYPNLQSANLIPSSIGILSACLKEAGFEVKVFDTTLYKTKDGGPDDKRVEYGHFRAYSMEYMKTDVFYDFKKLVGEYKPGLIGVSAVDSTYELGLKLISNINHEKIHIIFGGVFPTFSPEELIRNKHVDSICIGEGEETLVELCKCLQNEEPILHIENLMIKKLDGSIIKNKLRKVVDIDKLPHENFDAFNEERFLRPMQGKLKRMLPVMIDRGCPFVCTFCVEHAVKSLFKEADIGSNYRTKSVEIIKDNLEHLVAKYKPDYIYFNSETLFAYPIKKFVKLAEFYSEKINLPFFASTRIETVSDDKIKILKNMGCDRLSFAIEHGNEEFRKKVLKKQFSNKQVLKAFEIVKKNGLASTNFNIVGFPDETRELAFDTIRLNREVIYGSEIDITTSISPFQPYTGTFLRNVCLEKGYIKDLHKGGSLTSNSVLNMPGFTSLEIEGICRTFAMYVKMPESFWPEIEVAEKFDETGNREFDRLKEIYLKDYFAYRHS